MVLIWVGSNLKTALPTIVLCDCALVIAGDFWPCMSQLSNGTFLRGVDDGLLSQSGAGGGVLQIPRVFFAVDLKAPLLYRYVISSRVLNNKFEDVSPYYCPL